MPTLEIALFPVATTFCLETDRQVNPALSKEQIEEAWSKPELEGIVKEQPGLHAIYTGSVPTHPGWFAIVVVWESIHAHHKFQHSSAYATFLAAAVTIVAGPIDVKHFEISEDREGLKRALEAPITGMSVLPVKKGKAAEFLSFYNDTYAKYVVGDTYNGMWFHYPYEDPFDFYAFYGWESEQAHYDNMKQEKHKGFHESFADCIDATRGCKVYHLELKKAYGDW